VIFVADDGGRTLSLNKSLAFDVGQTINGEEYYIEHEIVEHYPEAGTADPMATNRY
jgi:hypothetical protein